MATQVLVSTAEDPARSALGDQWRYAGSVAEQRETELWKVVQGCLGLRAGSGCRSVEFYVDLDPEAPGYADLEAARSARAPEATRLTSSRLRFWFALTYSGRPDQALIAAQPAELAPMHRRPPEPHPGLRARGVPVGVRLTAGASGLFDVVPSARS